SGVVIDLCAGLTPCPPNLFRQTFAPGHHVVTLTVSDGKGGTDHATVDLTVPDLVILVHGIFGQPDQTTFGQFGPLLANEGYTVMPFDYAKLTGCNSIAAQTSIYEIANGFEQFIVGTV